MLLGLKELPEAEKEASRWRSGYGSNQKGTFLEMNTFSAFFKTGIRHPR